MKCVFKKTKLKIRIGTIILCGIILLPITALAEIHYYTNNNNNVQFTEEQYNKYLIEYGKERIANFTQEEFDILNFDYKIVDVQDKYFITDYYLNE